MEVDEESFISENISSQTFSQDQMELRGIPAAMSNAELAINVNTDDYLPDATAIEIVEFEY